VAFVSRLFDWFWLRSTERAVLGEADTPSPRVHELVGRAAVAREVAARTARPREPFVHAGSDVVSAELYRESIHWALLAHAARRGGDVAAPADIASLLAATDLALLEDAAGGAAGRTELELELTRSYREFAELEPSARQRLVERLERASEALLEPLATAERRLERIRARRVVHVLGALLLLGVATLGTQHLLLVQARVRDLALGASFTTSSRYAVGGCQSPKQVCGGGEHYFFHTNQEDDPSVTFDLGKERRISGVEIDNRLDCCTERAVPLAVAVSSDRKTWREVARTTKDFATWRESFDAVRARYVKVHVPAPNSILHLSRVRIFP
jgi:hypothetical protein